MAGGGGAQTERESQPDPGRIGQLASDLRVNVGAEVVAGLIAYGRLFLRWNEAINLSGSTTAENLVARHYADAFVAAGFVKAGDSVVDVGSGGGLPALPLALMTEANFSLYEPTAKKVAFLRTAVRELGLTSRVSIHPGRVEEPLGPELKGSFDVAMSRATFQPAVWLGLGRSLIRPGGQVLVFATDRLFEGCPSPAASVSYGAGLRLMSFSES